MYHATDSSLPDRVNTPSTANGNREIRPRDLAAKKVSRLACLTSLVNVSRDRLQSEYVLLAQPMGAEESGLVI